MSNPSFDASRFREVLGHYPTGVALITAISPVGSPVGMVVGSFNSVSLEPPLVSFMPMKNSQTFQQLRSVSHFTVNVLAHDQEKICRRFASKMGDKFDGVLWSESSNGSPIIDGVVASIDCTFGDIHEAGDHLIVLGQVDDMRVHRPVNPLLFFQGGYGGFTPRLLLARTDSELADSVTAGYRVREHLSGLGDELGCEVVAYARLGNEFAPVARSGGFQYDPADIPLGERLPIIAPLGDFFVEGDNEKQDWLGITNDEETRGLFQQRLEISKQRGWSISLSSAQRSSELHKALISYTEEPSTPAKLRSITTVITQAIAEYTPFEIEDDELYNIATVAAPVPSAHRTEIVLALNGLPQSVFGSKVRRWIEALTETTTKCAKELAIN